MVMRVRENERGQILILTAVSMVVLLGLAALSLDASFMYEKRNRLFAAADAAAKSAAIEVHRGNTTSGNLLSFAQDQVAYHGYATADLVQLNNPPLSGPFAGDSKYVEAIVQETTSTFFATVLGFATMTPGARAVAGMSSSTTCLATLSSGNSSLSIGNGTLNLPGCSVQDAGGLDATNPNASITNSPEIDVSANVGCWDHCSTSNFQNLKTPVPASTDPLSSLSPPTVSGSCTSQSGSALTLSPGCYSTINATGPTVTLDFQPGIYKITGPLTTGNNATVTCSTCVSGPSGAGVLLYLTGSGSITTNQHQTWTLSGLTATQTGCSVGTIGCLTGLLFYQDPSDTQTANFDSNNSTYSLTGAFYFPNADVIFNNGLNLIDTCSLIVAKTFTVNNGNGTLTNSGCGGAFGGSPLQTVSMAE
jgi:Flp pilus assembly protein TadG